jgi:myo-inositol-1(or 4)-monophosphatase
MVCHQWLVALILWRVFFGAEVDMHQYLEVARDAALKAGRLLKENINGRREVSYKGEINLVTEMDRLSEKIVVEMLLGAFPHHGILAEEGARIENGSGFLWIIDPLDGTTNYAHGYPSFSVSIGLQRDGELAAGVVFDPMRDELFSAVQGGGAFLNGRPLSVSHNDTLIRSLLATGFPYDRTTSRENNLDYFNALIMASQEVRRSGSASLDLCSVAAGRLDGYWELKLSPWDVAAGALIVREAGGTISDFSGVRFNIHDREIVASNGRIHRQMLEVIRRVAFGPAESGAAGERGAG